MAKTFTAGANLTGKEGYAVKADGTNNKVILATANSINFGILTTVGGNADGAPVGVAKDGERVLAKIGGTITFGAKLKSDANGALVVSTTDLDNVIAEAEANAVAGDMAYVIVQKYEQ